MRGDAQSDGHDATWWRVGISALTTLLNHSSTSSELASVNSPPSSCITWYLLNVMKSTRARARARLSSFSPLRFPLSIHPQEFPMVLERESIMLVDTLDIHMKIVCLLEKPAASGCRYPVCMACYIIVTSSSQIAAKERLSRRMLESFATVVRST